MPAFETQLSANSEEASIEDGKCLWSSLLKEVTTKANVKLPSTRALIVLGDDESGKTTLIARLQGTEDPKQSYGLEYTFIDVKDEDRDDQTKLNVWILDGDVVHSHLLKFALNADNFGECVVVIVVSMSEPWNIMESLDKWSNLLDKHIKRLDIPLETLSEYKDGLVNQFRNYVEPDSLLAPATPAPVTYAPLPTAAINARRPNMAHALHPATAALLSSTLGPAMAPTASAEATEENGDETIELTTVPELPLDKSVLSENLGIPMVVVVTKTDVINTLEKEERYTDEHFDFIQMHIRRFCLNYGAALFYLSVKEDKNCDLLSRYLQSRIYGFPFTQTAYVVERDCIFVPAGWDNGKKIGILEENFTQIRPSDGYNDVIVRPPPRKLAVREPELLAQDEQVFLTRLLVVQRDANNTANNAGQSGPGAGNIPTEAMVEQLSAAAAGSPSLNAARQSMGSPRSPAASLRGKPSPVSASSVASCAPSASGTAARASEGVLANFFTSLLNKRSNVVGTPTNTPAAANLPVSDKIGMSPKDIQVELERLARSSREALDVSKTLSKEAEPVETDASTQLSEETQPTEVKDPAEKTELTPGTETSDTQPAAS